MTWKLGNFTLRLYGWRATCTHALGCLWSRDRGSVRKVNYSPCHGEFCQMRDRVATAVNQSVELHNQVAVTDVNPVVLGP